MPEKCARLGSRDLADKVDGVPQKWMGETIRHLKATEYVRRQSLLRAFVPKCTLSCKFGLLFVKGLPFTENQVQVTLMSDLTRIKQTLILSFFGGLDLPFLVKTQ